MRSIFRVVFILLVMTFVLSRFVVTSPALAASITCDGDALATVAFDTPAINSYRLNGTGPGVPTNAYLSSDTSPESFAWVLPGPGTWNVTLEWRRPPSVPDWDASMYDSSVRLSCLDTAAGPPAGNLLDGRINNNQSKDVAAPVAIYCADGNVDVYKIDAETGDGTRIISVRQVEGTLESTQLLGSAQGVELYWLDTGEYQINTTNFEGYPYWINWVGCNSATLVHTYN